MGDEIQEAAERLRRNSYQYLATRHHRRWDEAVLARAWLAEHPTDGNIPVTEEWLKGWLGEQRELKGRRGRMLTGVSGGTFCLWVNGELIWTAKHADYYQLTRGDVDRLGAALGIELPVLPVSLSEPPIKEGASQ